MFARAGLQLPVGYPSPTGTSKNFGEAKLMDSVVYEKGVHQGKRITGDHLREAARTVEGIHQNGRGKTKNITEIRLMEIWQ